MNITCAEDEDEIGLTTSGDSGTSSTPRLARKAS